MFYFFYLYKQKALENIEGFFIFILFFFSFLDEN